MEDYVVVLCSVSLLLLLCGGGKAFYSIWWKPKMLERRLKQQGIRGTPYTPLIGDMKEFVRQIKEAWSKPMSLNHQIVSRVDPFTLNTVQRYGMHPLHVTSGYVLCVGILLMKPIFGLCFETCAGKISMCWVGTTPRLIIMDTEIVKEVLSNKLGHFHKPPLNPQILILTKGLSTLQGEKWVKHRRIINPAFHLEKLKGMIPVFAVSCSKMIEQWKENPFLQGRCEIDIWPELQKLTADVISRAAFGSTYAEGRKVFELQRELLTLTVEAMQTLYIPGFRFIPTKKNQRRKKLHNEITSMLRNIVQNKINAMRAGESSVDDLLGLLLQSNGQTDLSENASSTRSNEMMTIEDVIEECKMFYLAGQETTSSLLTWTMIVLAMHPDWQEKAREEVLRVCGEKEPNFEAIGRLKIVNMILNEVLRLYPPAIASYQHAYKETKVGDIVVPAGVDLNLPTLLIHHDPELWGDDAVEFKPERFSEGVSKASKDQQQAFFPFGWGPRICIGQSMAMIEAKVALAMILQQFSFELSPSYTHAPYTLTILQPQHGAQVILHQL
uniref:cytochrome P450 72A15-like isoform X1 n=1 Tax=Fragaria vesca subsp. vesca TaxID=101020 RepID=UPI0005CB453C|nr:PREDICTED: cytochrome P450 72A15-like isoform X1 [Fragaria vesca subsp. vesca]